MSTVARRVVAILATLPCTIAATHAQDELPRSRTFGIARLADGTPWVGATVQLTSAAPTLGSVTIVDAIDHITTNTDERGRFHAAVLAGHDYCVWASAEQVDGATLYSKSTESSSAGDRIELVAEDTPVTRGVIHFLDLPKDIARPLHVAIFHSGTGLRFTQPLGDGDTLELPSVPRSWLGFSLCDGNGALVLRAGVLVPSADDSVIRPRRPRWIKVRVFDLERRRPIPGARLEALLIDGALQLGATDADGFALIDIAPFGAHISNRDASPQESILVNATEFAPSCFILPKTGSATREEAAGKSEPDVEIQPPPKSAPGPRLRLRVGDRALASAPVIGRFDAWSPRSDIHAPRTRRMTRSWTTTSDGSVDLSAMSPDHLSLELVLDATVLRALPASWREHLPPVSFLPLPAGADPHDLDLLKVMRPIDLFVVSADGGTPAGDAQVRFSRSQHGEGLTGRTDRAGRMRVLAAFESPQPLTFWVMHDFGWCAHQIDPGGPVGAADPVARLRVALLKPIFVRLKVTPGALGELPAECTARISYEPATRGGIPPEVSVLASAEGERGAPSLQPVDWSHAANLVSSSTTSKPLVDGKVEFSAPAFSRRLRIIVLGMAADRLVSIDRTFTLRGNEDAIDVDLSFDK